MAARPPLSLAPLLLLLALVALWPPQRGPAWERRFQRPVTALAFSPDARMLAVCTDEPAVHLVDARDGAYRSRLPAPTMVHTLSYSQDGRRLFVAGYGGMVQWDLGPKEAVLRVDGPLAAAAVTADGRVILTGDNLTDRGGRCEDYFLTGYRDGQKTWSEHGEDVCIDTLYLPPEGDRYLARWRNRGRYLGWGLGSPHGRGKFIGQGQCRFSPDGSRIAHREAEKLRLLDGRTLQLLAGPVEPPAGGLAFSPDGERLLAFSDGVSQCYGARQLNPQGRLAGPDSRQAGFLDDRMALAANDVGHWLVWDTGTGKIHRQRSDSVPKLRAWAGQPGQVALGGAEGDAGLLKVFSR